MLKINEKTQKALIAKVASLTPNAKFPVIATYTDADNNKVVEAFEIKFAANAIDPLFGFTCKNIYYVLKLNTREITPFESAIAAENYDAVKIVDFFCNFYLVKYFDFAKDNANYEPKYKVEFNPVSVELIF